MKITFISGIGIQLPIPLISISYLSAAIKASGRHRVNLIDCFLKPDKIGYILKRIKEDPPEIIGFSVMSSYVQGSLVAAEKIKEKFPKIKIIFGGVHAILRPLEILNNPAVEAVCVGEAEEAVVEYLDKLEAGQAPRVQGFWYKDGPEIVRNQNRPLIGNLDSLPYPDWEIWDMSVYMNSLMYVLGSRGCPFACAYCCTAALREKLCGGQAETFYRVRSASNIIGEIKRNLKQYGFDGFLPLLFCDSIFGFNRQQFNDFTDLYLQEGLNKVAPWKCLVVANNVDEDWVRRAKNSGCFAVDMGLEHPDEKFRMENLGKMISNQDFQKATALLNKYGIPYELYLLIGSRGETFRDVLFNLKRAGKFEPLLFCINVYVPLPETRLWDQYPTRKIQPNLPKIEQKESAFKNYRLLVWALKLINQLAIMNTAGKLYGFRLPVIFFKIFLRITRSWPVDLIDGIRLFNHHIQQYYIYRFFVFKIKNGTYPVDRDVFYVKSKS